MVIKIDAQFPLKYRKMRQFKNNLKRNRNRNNHDRGYKRSNDIDRLNGNFVNSENGFRRKLNRGNGN